MSNCTTNQAQWQKGGVIDVVVALVVLKFADARLVISEPGMTQAELAHEALIRTCESTYEGP
jgi:hypothetical protein